MTMRIKNKCNNTVRTMQIAKQKLEFKLPCRQIEFRWVHIYWHAKVAVVPLTALCGAADALQDKRQQRSFRVG